MRTSVFLRCGVFLILICCNNVLAQDLNSLENDLDAMLNEKQTKKKEYVKYTFKGTRVVNLQSVEKVAPGALQFLIQHRFGPLNGGPYQLYGLDQATIRFGLEYGLSNFMSVGVGRSSYNKNFDGYVKTTVVRQSKGGPGSFPLSILYFGSVSVKGTKFDNPDVRNYFSSRMSYTHQIIIGSKVNENFSFEIVPTYIHKNLVGAAIDPNDFYAIGFGARYRLSKRISLNGEYIYRIPPKHRNAPAFANFYNSMSLGFDIETGGHVFQLHLTNSLPMYETAFITETAETWKNGGIHLGFNISRDFVIKKPASPWESKSKKKEEKAKDEVKKRPVEDAKKKKEEEAQAQVKKKAEEEEAQAKKNKEEDQTKIKTKVEEVSVQTKKSPSGGKAGILIDNLNGNINPWWAGNSKTQLSKKDGALQVDLKDVGPDYDVFGRSFTAIDFSKTPVIKVRMKAVGGKPAILRIDIKDSEGHATNSNPASVAFETGTDYVDYYFDFTGRFKQARPTSKAVDITKIEEILLFVNPGGESYFGIILIDDIRALTKEEFQNRGK
jgi:hypothetical protein